MRVIPTLNPPEDSQTGVDFSFPTMLGNKFTFKAGKEAFGHGIVISITDGTHRQFHTHFLTTLSKGEAGVLTTVVVVMDYLTRSPLLNSHV
jgi:hypothetical protein